MRCHLQIMIAIYLTVSLTWHRLWQREQKHDLSDIKLITCRWSETHHSVLFYPTLG